MMLIKLKEISEEGRTNELKAKIGENREEQDKAANRIKKVLKQTDWEG